MEIIKEKLKVAKHYSSALRKLVPGIDCLVVDIGVRQTVSSIASKLKKAEGLVFITRKDGNKLKVQRIADENASKNK